MNESESVKLVKLIDTKISELKSVCEGIDEQIADRAPEGRWSPKQILSHLLGPEGKGMMATVTVFFDENMPRIDVEAANPFYTENRAKMTLKELMTEVELEYSRIAGFASALDPSHLSRKAHIPMMKDSAIGEYPTLGEWIEAIACGHIVFHIRHMNEIVQQIKQ